MMTDELRVIIMLLCSPFLIIALHMVWSRIDRLNMPQTVALRSILIGYLPAAFIFRYFLFSSWTFDAETAFAIFYCFVVYSSFAYAYFHLFNMSETARRIRIIHEIRRAGVLRWGELTDLYQSRDIIELRLERLVAMNELIVHDGCYRMNSRLLYSAAIFIAWWRKLLGFKEIRASSPEGGSQ